MTAVYLANVTGDGLSPATAYRAAGFDAVSYAVLMVDSVKGRALLASPVDTVAGAGVSRLMQAATWAELVDRARTSNPTNAQRNALATWLSGGGYAPLTADQVSWWDCIHHAARQVNPAADLALTSVG